MVATVVKIMNVKLASVVLVALVLPTAQELLIVRTVFAQRTRSVTQDTVLEQMFVLQSVLNSKNMEPTTMVAIVKVTQNV